MFAIRFGKRRCDTVSKALLACLSEQTFKNRLIQIIHSSSVLILNTTGQDFRENSIAFCQNSGFYEHFEIFLIILKIMKYLLCSALILLTMPVFPQNIQLHYDLRHSLDPKLNPKNFPSFSFEYFKNNDTLNNGSFLFKLDSRLDGKKSNMGQVFTQLSQSIKFWKPKIYLSLTYSGGLGVTSTNFGYYLSNSFGIGPGYTFQWIGAWISACAYFNQCV